MTVKNVVPRCWSAAGLRTLLGGGGLIAIFVALCFSLSAGHQVVSVILLAVTLLWVGLNEAPEILLYIKLGPGRTPGSAEGVVSSVPRSRPFPRHDREAMPGPWREPLALEAPPWGSPNPLLCTSPVLAPGPNPPEQVRQPRLRRTEMAPLHDVCAAPPHGPTLLHPQPRDPGCEVAPHQDTEAAPAPDLTPLQLKPVAPRVASPLTAEEGAAGGSPTMPLGIVIGVGTGFLAFAGVQKLLARKRGMAQPQAPDRALTSGRRGEGVEPAIDGEQQPQRPPPDGTLLRESGSEEIYRCRDGWRQRVCSEDAADVSTVVIVGNGFMAAVPLRELPSPPQETRR